ncbi:kinase-like protein [Ramicandelaber brevisporus]|nr:kinase-like protein [Ramicandelaber brevisporus]
MPGLSLADLGVPAASLTPAGAAAAEASMVAVNAGGTRASATAAAAAAAAAATATSTSSATSSGTPFGGFAQFVDASGSLNFANKAAIHAGGVDFSSGTSYAINMSELDVKEELGRGQYGVVHRVLHKPTGAVMAMKQIRLELDNTRFKQIITELDVLNQASSPFIVDFYGAFFVESCVYYCMECMDGGSLQRLYTITHGGSEESTDQQQSGSGSGSSSNSGGGGGVPEHILARVGYAVVSGLHFLKTKLNVIHRDVKPSNVLCSRAGDIKLCDFGVSGQLVQSLANTYTGCQAYLAPERIVGESKHSYTVQSDVWSFGITLVECSMGRYPYESVQYESMFAQLDAIVNGEPPLPPAGSVSDTCVDFLSKCLEKEPAKRASYPKLLEHPFLTAVADAPKDEMAKWTDSERKQRVTTAEDLDSS